jgi:hypothetical protein
VKVAVQELAQELVGQGREISPEPDMKELAEDARAVEQIFLSCSHLSPG